jgi:glycosyltransferase involved in cell wall biosynthesis
VELARDASARGDHVAVAAAPGPYAAELGALGVQHLELPPSGRSPRALLGAGRALDSAIRRFAPDVVHAHNPKLGALAALVARRPRRGARPVLVTSHQGVAPADARLAALALRGSDHVVAVSDSISRQLVMQGLPRARLTVIPNGVPAAERLDPERRAQLEAELGIDGRPVVTAVGRLVPQKAHARFLEAAATVGRRGVDARFLIVGGGPLRAVLEGRAGALGLSRAVRFTGTRGDARAIISCSDMLVFSSEWEGLSLAAVEALAAGVPVISTDVAGSAELLSTGAGLVVSREPDAIAQAIVDLIGDPGRRALMAEEGRRLHAERFSSERMVRAYREMYEAAAAEGPTPLWTGRGRGNTTTQETVNG